MKNIIGRVEEKEHLKNILGSNEPELVAVYGRRRVGKTFLITNIFEKELVFELSGIHNASLHQQLENFSFAMAKATSKKKSTIPANWMDAFDMLQEYLVPIVKKRRTVIFIDEFPWLNTPRSGFLPAFENFWNTWASRQYNLVVIICGSAASWMINKVINSRGGLHNRVTRKLRLLPFTVGETADFLKERKINLDQYQVLQLYMAMGGVPQYLKEINKGESAAQAIDRICFTKEGLLFEEFKNLYHSLFEDASNHTNVIRALARKGSGLTRSAIIDACKLTSGGGATQLLDELTESGFITPYIPFDRTAKDSVYKLTDEYSHFYVKFIESSRSTGAGTWLKFSTGASWKSWAGNAFESICMKHTLQLKKALGIESVYTETSLWRYAPDKQEQEGAQIDLLIDRQDRCINICEMKFSIMGFDISKGYAKELENKLNVFRQRTKTKKTLFLTMVTTYGVKNNLNYTGLIQNNITMEFLFR
ncbi:ATP-binding protein [Ferruginibacter sp. HRS2-29]|uniref:AAA family ATPase n=1 Tax=Ferruginibacter sp. HRS2-29 TaxID=2487334 RepID=UPI0020CEEA17|nr:ATP-binding protein [Ferruginibacter sp. HRS2-29]MCP9751163.1 ATP-binding protein [Ferruginibacter sp. HRS2-29]